MSFQFETLRGISVFHIFAGMKKDIHHVFVGRGATKIDGRKAYKSPYMITFPAKRGGGGSTFTLDGGHDIKGSSSYVRHVNNVTDLHVEELEFLVKRVNELEDVMVKLKDMIKYFE